MNDSRGNESETAFNTKVATLAPEDALALGVEAYMIAEPIAYQAPVTFSEEHIKRNRFLHKCRYYGTDASKYAGMVKELRSLLKTSSVMDYGAGEGKLAASLDFPIWEYDPAVDGKDSAPRAADIVVCINVLEYVESAFLDAVLEDIQRLMNQAGLFVIALPNEREWWIDKLKRYFDLSPNCVMERDGQLMITVGKKRI